MQTHEIPRDTWFDFLTRFSKEHHDAPVRVEVDGRDIGEQPVGGHLALEDISFEKKGSEKGDITLTLSGKGGETTHRIQQARRVYVEEQDDGAVATLDIEDQERHKTLVTFEALPELPP